MPIPGRPWFCYSVSLIGPSPPPADLKHGVDPTMCIPIFPNTEHPEGRRAVYPEPSFPFDHCYHWYRTRMTVRVRARPEGWNEDEAVYLPSDDLHTMGIYLLNDALRSRHARDPAPRCISVSDDPLEDEDSDSAFWDSSPGGRSVHPFSGNQPVSNHVSTRSSPDPSSPTDPSSNASESVSNLETGTHESRSSSRAALDAETVSVDSIISATDLQTLRRQAKDAALFPVVDLWYDLAGHLTQDEIGSPVDFFEERAAIIKWVLFCQLTWSAFVGSANRPSCAELLRVLDVASLHVLRSLSNRSKSHKMSRRSRDVSGWPDIPAGRSVSDKLYDV